MICDVYKSAIKPDRYILVKSGTPLNSLPRSIQKEIVSKRALKTIDTQSNPPPIGLNIASTIADIQKNGYHIQLTKTEIEEGKTIVKKHR